MLAILARLVADAAFIAIVLFGAAGTPHWEHAWVLLGVMLVVRIAGAIAVYRVNPALLRERAKLPVHGDQPAAVADTGVYTVVRHPFYVGTVLVLVGMALWLGSYAAALFAVVPVAFIVLRLTAEERFLHRELLGYDQYAARVPHRLVPGLW